MIFFTGNTLCSNVGVCLRVMTLTFRLNFISGDLYDSRKNCKMLQFEELKLNELHSVSQSRMFWFLRFLRFLLLFLVFCISPLKIPLPLRILFHLRLSSSYPLFPPALTFSLPVQNYASTSYYY